MLAMSERRVSVQTQEASKTEAPSLEGLNDAGGEPDGLKEVRSLEGLGDVRNLEGLEEAGGDPKDLEEAGGNHSLRKVWPVQGGWAGHKYTDYGQRRGVSGERP